jgi:hypothetical protein
MSKMGSHFPFGHLKHKLWPKEGSGVKLTIWLSTTKSQESTHFCCVQVACDMSLESPQRGLQLCFRPHHNPRFSRKVMGPQSCGVLTLIISRLPLGSPRTKSNLDVGLMGSHKVYYKGEGGGFPQVRSMMNLVNSSCSWFVLAPKVLQQCIN